jgi:hypothetical protein
MIIFGICFSFNVFAKTQEIPVITRFQPSSPSYQAMFFFIKKLNSIQDKYIFIPQTVPGALGESADQRALTIARSGENLIWYGPVSSFTLNRFELGNTYDRDNDFYFIRSFLTTYQSLVVSKNSNINTLDELIKRLKSKNKNFYGAPLEIGAAKFLNNILIKYTDTQSIMIKYKDFAEITLALNNKEIDYSIMTFPSVGESLLEIENTKKSIIPNFRYETLSSFAVPKEIKTFGEIAKPYFDKLCNDTELLKFYEKIKYEEVCYDDYFIKQRIKEEVELISKFQ